MPRPREKRTPGGSRCLVAYFSRSGENYVAGDIVDLAIGNTAVVASAIGALTGGDLVEIETLVPYPTTYREATEVARRELRDKARPELRNAPESVHRYDVVFLGFPNWWGTAPMPVFTFLESHDFSGKTIVPFCTHEGSGMGRSERDVSMAAPGARVLDGLALRGAAVHGAEVSVRAWVESTGLRF